MLSIGQVAKMTQVRIETIRFYEREGLIPKPARKPSGYRQYTDEVILRLHFIRRAKGLGFSLTEIKDLLSLRTGKGTCCKAVRQKAIGKANDIERKIAALKRMILALQPLIDQCREESPISECPILNALDHEEVNHAREA